MKSRNLFWVILLSVFFTSCTVTQVPSNAQVNVNWDLSYYNYDQIHYLYSNYPSYFWNYQYVNSFGISTYYYNHPYFIRYRRDCIRRNVAFRPYRQYNGITYNNRNRYYNNKPRYNNNNRQRAVVQNRGRSNQTYKQPQRTPRRINRTTTQRTSQNRTVYRSTQQRSTQNRSSSYRKSTPQRSIQRSRGSTAHRRSIKH